MSRQSARLRDRAQALKAYEEKRQSEEERSSSPTAFDQRNSDCTDRLAFRAGGSFQGARVNAWAESSGGDTGQRTARPQMNSRDYVRRARRCHPYSLILHPSNCFGFRPMSNGTFFMSSSSGSQEQRTQANWTMSGPSPQFGFARREHESLSKVGVEAQSNLGKSSSPPRQDEVESTSVSSSQGANAQVLKSEIRTNFAEQSDFSREAEGVSMDDSETEESRSSEEDPMEDGEDGELKMKKNTEGEVACWDEDGELAMDVDLTWPGRTKVSPSLSDSGQGSCPQTSSGCRNEKCRDQEKISTKAAGDIKRSSSSQQLRYIGSLRDHDYCQPFLEPESSAECNTGFFPTKTPTAEEELSDAEKRERKLIKHPKTDACLEHAPQVKHSRCVKDTSSALQERTVVTKGNAMVDHCSPDPNAVKNKVEENPPSRPFSRTKQANVVPSTENMGRSEEAPTSEDASKRKNESDAATSFTNNALRASSLSAITNLLPANIPASFCSPEVHRLLLAQHYSLLLAIASQPNVLVQALNSPAAGTRLPAVSKENDSDFVQRMAAAASLLNGSRTPATDEATPAKA